MNHLADCALCPRRCHADRQHSTDGYCGQPQGIRIARIAPHYWEEPFLSGTNGSGTVFFCGCNLRCCYCQNSVLLSPEVGTEVSPAQLENLILDLQAQGVHNINLVTATHYTRQMVPVLEKLRKNHLKIPVVWNSSAYETTETLAMLDGLVDIYLPDYKYSSAALAKEYSYAEDYPQIAIAAIQEMLRQVGSPKTDGAGMMYRGVQVRHLVLPGHSRESRQALYTLYQSFGEQIGLSIMNQYTPMPQMVDHPLLSRRVTAKEYDSVIRYAVSIGWQNALIQEEESASESFIPHFCLTKQQMEQIRQN